MQHRHQRRLAVVELQAQQFGERQSEQGWLGHDGQLGEDMGDRMPLLGPLEQAGRSIG